MGDLELSSAWHPIASLDLVLTPFAPRLHCSTHNSRSECFSRSALHSSLYMYVCDCISLCCWVACHRLIPRAEELSLRPPWAILLSTLYTFSVQDVALLAIFATCASYISTIVDAAYVILGFFSFLFLFIQHSGTTWLELLD